MEWSMWANENSIISSGLLCIGGIVGVAGKFSNWEFAATTIPLSILLFVIEYPRGKRIRGRTKKRILQSYIGKYLNRLGGVYKNYFIRFIFQLIIAIPSCFLLPTIIGGLCLLFGAILYLIAAFNGECWKLVTEERGERTLVLEQPTRPAPRAPYTNSHFSQIYQNFPGDNTNIEQ